MTMTNELDPLPYQQINPPRHTISQLKLSSQMILGCVKLLRLKLTRRPCVMCLWPHSFTKWGPRESRPVFFYSQLSALHMTGARLSWEEGFEDAQDFPDDCFYSLIFPKKKQIMRLSFEASNSVHFQRKTNHDIALTFKMWILGFIIRISDLEYT